MTNRRISKFLGMMCLLAPMACVGPGQIGYAIELDSGVADFSTKAGLDGEAEVAFSFNLKEIMCFWDFVAENTPICPGGSRDMNDGKTEEAAAEK